MENNLGETTLKLMDGTEVNLTANYGLLNKLRRMDRAAYNNYNEAYQSLGKEIDWATSMILYSTYLMGYIGEHGSLKESMTEDEFLELIPYDRASNSNIVRELIAPNSKTASAKRS